jgi:hypothetical protein
MEVTMKFLVNFTLSAEAGAKLEGRPGGWLVATLDTTQVTELMCALTDISGSHPRFSVVMAVQDFGAVAGAAIPAAKKLVE